MKYSLLTSYWITTPHRNGPLGFGVTAWSLEDALNIIRGWGYMLSENTSSLDIRENITVADLEEQHVIKNMGPIVVRGLWYPFNGIGVPRWMSL